MGLVPKKYSNSVEKYKLEYIRPYHREIARRLVLGQRQAQIAQDLGISQTRLSIIVNSPLFQRELKRLEELRDSGVGDVFKTLQDIAPVALETVERLMYQSKSEKIKLEAAQAILDRAGFGTTSKVDVRSVVTHQYHNYTNEELFQLVKERLRVIEEEMRAKQELLESDKQELLEVKSD